MEDFNNHITKIWSLKSLVIPMFTLSGFVAACPIYLFTDFKLVEVKDGYTTKKLQLLQSFKSVASQTLVEIYLLVQR